MLKDYQSNVEELSKKNKTKPFLKGLKEIKDPSTWPKKGQFDDYSAAVEQSLPTDDQPTEAKRRKSTGGQNDGSGGEKKKRKRTTEVWIVCVCCSCICVYSIID